MRISFFSFHDFERVPFERANGAHGHKLHFIPTQLTQETVALANGSAAVCAFVSDQLDGGVLEQLHEVGIRLVLLRSAGFDNVDLTTAEKLEMPVLRVPGYSPHAVAEHAFALLLALNRKIPQARDRVRDGNFSLDRLVGFDLYGKTFGVIGTGRIGEAAARIARGFGCDVLAFDPMPNRALEAESVIHYVSMDELLSRSDILSLHAPLTPQTKHLIDEAKLAKMKPGSILINTSRGGLVDTTALIDALKRGHLKGAGLDVYEWERALFFQDRFGEVLSDEHLMWLLHLPNVLITAHQGFLTEEALGNIASTTLSNATAFEECKVLVNQVQVGAAKPPKT